MISMAFKFAARRLPFATALLLVTAPLVFMRKRLQEARLLTSPRITVRRPTLALGFYSGGGNGTARLMVSNSVASSNSFYGIYADGTGIVRASNNTVSGNAWGLVQGGTGILESGGNNTVRGSLNETEGTITTFGLFVIVAAYNVVSC